MKAIFNIPKRVKYITAIILAAAVTIVSIVIASGSLGKNSYKSYVMGPLGKVTNWASFSKQLSTLKSNGVYGITTDIWWDYVEPNAEGLFDWDYYKTYANTVRASGLKWAPILSTHQCSTNSGDSVYIPLPSWVWSKDSQNNMQYKDENGVWDKEALSPWYSGTAELYDEIYASFARNFAGYKDIISRIEISTGPSGELRYPSYNAAAGWTYPDRGYLECYSDAAITNFQITIKAKYGTISAVNKAWNTALADFSQVKPPQSTDDFFENGYKTTYGRDFLTWYQGSLTSELAKITKTAHTRFDRVFDVDIGAKVSGVHWLYGSPTTPHAAEYCAGYYNYSTLLDQFKASRLDLTFTCLEMSDNNTSPNYSMPQTLVKTVASLALAKGITHSGENALAISNDPQAYRNAARMITDYHFASFSLLRINNIVYSEGGVSPEMKQFTKYLVSSKSLRAAVSSDKNQ